MIAGTGAEATARGLFSDGNSEDQVLNGIATGGEGWLRIAAQLQPFADGAAGEGLIMAIQEALSRNPAAVLRLVQAKVFSANDACGEYGFGQIEDERPTSFLLRLVDHRIKVVGAVKLSSLVPARDACLDELKQLRERVTKH